MPAPVCQECRQPIVGRIDKKYCSDQCRFLHHNRRKRRQEVTIGNVNRVLRRNRSVLRQLNPVGKTTVRQEVLTQMGFDFRFYTHVYRTQKGLLYYFCYELGYAFTNDDPPKCVLVTWQPYMSAEVHEILFENRYDAPE